MKLFFAAFSLWVVSLRYVPGGNMALLVLVLLFGLRALWLLSPSEQEMRRERGVTPYDWENAR